MFSTTATVCLFVMGALAVGVGGWGAGGRRLWGVDAARWRVYLGVFFGGLWVLFWWLTHVGGLNIYTQDAASVVGRSLDLIDTGRPVWFGNPFFQDYRLGPLANYLAALPLLVTRNVHAQYWFTNLLMALSLPVFYLALREVFDSGVARLAGGLSFAFALLIPFALDPVNRHFLPFFLALYALLLVKAVAGRAWAAVLLWLVIGLATHLHLSAAWLAPVTLVGSWGALRVLPRWTRLAGAMLLALTQMPLVWQLGEHLAAGRVLAKALCRAGVGSASTSLFASMIDFALMAPLNLGLVNLVFGAWALLAWRGLWRGDRGHRPLLVTACLGIVGGVVVFPVLAAIKHHDGYDYFAVTIPFFAFLVAFLFAELEKRHAVSPSKRYRGALIGLAVLALATCGEATWSRNVTEQQYSGIMRVDDQIRIARRLNDEIGRRGLQKIEALELVYEFDNGQSVLRSSNPETYRSLCCYLDPTMHSFLTTKPQAIVYAQIVPLADADRRGGVPRPPAAEKIGALATPNLFVTFFLGLDELDHYHKSIDVLHNARRKKSATALPL